MSFKTLEQAVVGTTNEVFGQEIVYTPTVGDPVTIKGVFSNSWVQIENFLSLQPVLRIKLTDLEASPLKGDEVSIEEVDYRVNESRLDGFGGTTLILQKA